MARFVLIEHIVDHLTHLLLVIVKHRNLVLH